VIVVQGFGPAQEQVLHQRLLRVHAVFGLVPDHALRAVDDRRRDFLAAMRRQAVHEQRLGTRDTHHLASTCQSAKSRMRSSFSASKPIEVHTSVVTRSAPRALHRIGELLEVAVP
jgi:hypothetical protein